jgi:hypothetical protein
MERRCVHGGAFLAFGFCGWQVAGVIQVMKSGTNSGAGVGAKIERMRGRLKSAPLRTYSSSACEDFIDL